MFAGDVFSRAIGVYSSGTWSASRASTPRRQRSRCGTSCTGRGGAARSLLPLSLSWADGAYSHALDDQGDVFGASADAHEPAKADRVDLRPAQSFVPPERAAPAVRSPPVVIG